MKAAMSRMIAPAAMLMIAALTGCEGQTVSWGRWNAQGLSAEPVTAAPTTAPAGVLSEPVAGVDADTGESVRTDENQADPLDPRLESYLRRLEKLQQLASEGVAAAPTATAPAGPHEPVATALTGRMTSLPPADAGLSAPPGSGAGDVPGEPQPAEPEIRDVQAEGPAPDAGPAPAVVRPVMPASGPSPDAAAQPPPETLTGPPTLEIVDIRAVLPEPAAGRTPTATVNQPAAPVQAVAPVDLPSLIEHLRRSAAERPPHLEDEFNLRLLQLADHRDEEATAEPQGLDPVQAELMTRALKAVADTRRAIRNPAEATPAALAAAQELSRALAQQTGVLIPKIALVTRVDSFGVYEPIQPLRFPAGRPVHAYVYTEVANFRCEPTADGRLRTLMSETVEVFDASGRCVWQRSQPQLEDHSRSPRRDFFIGFPIHLPADLPVGEYVLKVTLEDRIGGTADQQRLSFTIARP